MCNVEYRISNIEIFRHWTFEIGHSTFVVDSRFRMCDAQEILEQSLPVFRPDRLRMELHAVQRELAVLHRHDLAALATVTGPGGDDEVVRQTCPLHDQGVIAHCRER